MLTTLLFVVAFFVAGTQGNHACICLHGTTVTNIYTRPAQNATVIGSMFIYDCIPLYSGVSPSLSGWYTVALEHKVGYVQYATTVQERMCPGDVPDQHKVSTTFPRPTSQTTAATPASLHTITLTNATTLHVEPKQTTTTTTSKQTIRTTTQKPTTTTTAPKPTIRTTTSKSTTTTTTQKPTTTATTPKPTIRTTTSKPTTTTTTPNPTTSTTTTTPRPTIATTTTTRKPTTTHYISQCPAAVLGRNQDLSLIYKHRSYCYEFRNKLQDWEHAKMDCQNNGGFLLSIQSQDEQDFVLTMLTRLRKSQPIWLGLTDQIHEEQWQWVSGLPLEYNNWISGSHHDKYHDFEDCALYVSARQGGWDDVHCTGILFERPASHPWICQYPTTTPKPTTTTTPKPTPTPTTTPGPTTTTTMTTRKQTTTQYIPKCPAAVIGRNQDLSYIYKHRSYCYEFRNKLQDWEHAKMDCANNGGFLLSIQSQDEQDFVLTMLSRLRKSQPIWLGLSDQVHKEQWQWVSGLPVTYVNWMGGSHHDKYHDFQDCAVYVPARQGEWDDVHCKGMLFDRSPSHPWICQYRVV